MFSYTIRRLLHLIPIVFGVAVLIFVLFNLVGEDPVRIALGNHATTDAIADLRHQWGLDQPIHLQFIDFLKQIVTFDFGKSFNSGESLGALFRKGAYVSLMLTVPPYVTGVVLFVIIAMVIAYQREKFIDKYLRFAFVAMMSISYLVYIIVFQYLLAFKFELFPVRGFESGVNAIWYLGLPWIIIIATTMGPDIRIYRTVFLDEIGADYVRTARAKGAGESRVLFLHVLKNAMIPILTYSLVGIPYLLLGAFLMERFFSLPGVGDLMINAINTGDFPVLKGLTIIISIAYALINLLTDLAYAYLDPRVKLG
jgi:peptide/nickel transport system permease protein